MLPYLLTYLRSISQDEEGQDLLEYALLSVLLSIVAMAAITAAGTQVSSIFTNLSEALGG